LSIAIVDEKVTGEQSEIMRLIFDTELVTIRDVIARRVTVEVDGYNNKLEGRFQGLIEPAPTEKLLNGDRSKRRPPVDAQKQIAVALAAFAQNGFFILVDNKQFDRLDDEIIVAKTTTISFIKLTPLVGG
jgi:hypothetical protein